MAYKLTFTGVDPDGGLASVLDTLDAEGNGTADCDNLGEVDDIISEWDDESAPYPTMTMKKED